jgi:hypothetical protein
MLDTSIWAHIWYADGASHTNAPTAFRTDALSDSGIAALTRRNNCATAAHDSVMDRLHGKQCRPAPTVRHGLVRRNWLAR